MEAIIVWALAFAALVILAMWRQQRVDARRAAEDAAKAAQAEADAREQRRRHKKKSTQSQPRKPSAPQSSSAGVDAASRAHPMRLGRWKDHKDRVTALAWSPDGRFIASAAQDRVLRVARVDDVSKDVTASKPPAFLRLPLSDDHISALSFSPDSKCVVAALANSGAVRIFGIGRENHRDRLVVVKTFPTTHKAEIVSVAMSSCGRYIVTCSEDTHLMYWNPKTGEALETIDTKAVSHYGAAVSGDGRLVAVSSFVSDVKVYEASFTGKGAFEGVRKVMAVGGHRSAVACVSFAGSRLLTVSRDGTWRVHETSVRFGQGEDAHTLSSASFAMDDVGQAKLRAALTPDAKRAVLTRGNTLMVFDAGTGEAVTTVREAHVADVVGVCVSPCSKVACTSGDGRWLHFWKLA